jgi:polysaccharide deacetylase family protein (PEP-CTERM system associated)
VIPNALSVDLEEYFQVSNFQHVIGPDRWDDCPSRVADSARRLLDRFDETGSRATFFTLGWVAERQPALVREIAERGHEIASHGYAHEIVYEIGPDRFREDLRRSRVAIEDAVGARVEGYRAPSFSITGRSLWALDVLAEEGFAYDSSIFPVVHHRYGIPGFPGRPARLRLDGGREIAEFPLTALKVGGVTLPLAGGGWLRFLPPALFRWGWRRLARSGDPAVLYLHPWEIDPGQPVHDVDWKVRINHYHNLHRMEDRVVDLLERFAFAPLREVLAQLEEADRLPAQALEDVLPRAA